MIVPLSEPLLTVEEYLALPDNGVPTELHHGRVVPLYVPAPRHGQICSKVNRLVGNYAEEHDLGKVVTNDSGVVTRRGPDTVRGADVAFYSYRKVARGPLPQGYLDVVPELVFEVRSPTDRWPAILAKVAEYLEAGVQVVCVLDQQTEAAQLFRPDDPPLVVAGDDAFTLPELLGGFRVPVRRFFE